MVIEEHSIRQFSAFGSSLVKVCDVTQQSIEFILLIYTHSYYACYIIHIAVKQNILQTNLNIFNI
jgi:hypothetical protein